MDSQWCNGVNMVYLQLCLDWTDRETPLKERLQRLVASSSPSSSVSTAPVVWTMVECQNAGTQIIMADNARYFSKTATVCMIFML